MAAEYIRGNVMEMLVKMMEVLVKIAVMMMAPGSVPSPSGARGRGPPFFFFFFFFLDLLPRWEKGFPLWSLALMAWEGREPLRDWIYLSVSAFPDSALHRFFYIRRSVTPIGVNLSPRFFS